MKAEWYVRGVHAGKGLECVKVVGCVKDGREVTGWGAVGRCI